jgi:Protein of unknown function (DUF664)
VRPYLAAHAFLLGGFTAFCWLGSFSRLTPNPPYTGGERESLSAVLDWHRATFELQVRRPAARAAVRTAVSPSGLSLHGLVRHLADAER